MQQISVTEFKQWLDDGARGRPVLLDVREDWERARCALPDSIHLPMSQIVERLAELDPQADLVVYCHHGGRSAQVGSFLERRGVRSVFNLAGGIDAWSRTIDPSVPTY